MFKFGKFFDYEHHSLPHFDNMNFYFAPDDLLIKGKFMFWDNKFKFSGKNKMIKADNGISSSGDYTLDYFHSKTSSVRIIHKDNGTITGDANIHLHKHNDIMINLFANEKLTQTEKKRECPSDFKIRVAHPNALAEVGVAQWNILKLGAPEVLMANVMGTMKHDVFNFLLGGSFAFNMTKKMAQHHALLFGLHHEKATAYLHIRTDRSHSEDKTVVLQKHNVGLTVDSKLCSDLQVFGEANYNLADKANAEKDKKITYAAACEYNWDKNTRTKTKINQACEMMCAIIHNYNNMANFSVNCQVAPKWGGENSHTYANIKFGVQLELF